VLNLKVSSHSTHATSNTNSVSAIIGFAISALILLSLKFTTHAATVINLSAGGDLQAAINAAQPGDTIVVQAGAAYTVNLVLPAKFGTSYITIQSSRASELPDGARVGPSQSPMLARIQSGTAAEPVIKTAAGASYYKFVGVEIRTADASIPVYDLVRFGDSRQTQTTLNSVPHHLIIDRSYIHGYASQNSQRGVSMNCAECSITNSYISEIHGVGFDTQAVAGWNGPGPFKLINDYLEGAGENVLFGGADSASPDLMPASVEIRRSWLNKPLSWNFMDRANFVPLNGQSVLWTTSPLPCATEDQSQRYAPRYVDSSGCIAKHWTVKNILEFKAVNGATVDGNLLTNNWVDGQSGMPVLFTVRNQECTAPWSTVQNVVFTNNTVKGGNGGVNFLGMDNEVTAAFGKCNPASTSVRGTNATLSNNVFDVAAGNPFLTLNGFYGVSLSNNTHLQQGNLTILYGEPSLGFKYTNNLTADHPYGLYGDGGLIGSAALNQWTPGCIFIGNVIANPYGSYPSGNSYPASLTLSSDYRSPFPGVGADIDALNAAQSGSSPTPASTPTPTSTPGPTPTPTPSPSATPTPTPSPTPRQRNSKPRRVKTDSSTLAPNIHTSTQAKTVSRPVFYPFLLVPNSNENLEICRKQNGRRHKRSQRCLKAKSARTGADEKLVGPAGLAGTRTR